MGRKPALVLRDTINSIPKEYLGCICQDRVKFWLKDGMRFGRSKTR